MKLFRCNGKTLEVYDVTLLMQFRMISVPIKEHGWKLVEDDLARSRLREVIDSGLYERVV